VYEALSDLGIPEETAQELGQRILTTPSADQMIDERDVVVGRGMSGQLRHLPDVFLLADRATFPQSHRKVTSPRFPV
jgi:hypothetical protein